MVAPHFLELPGIRVELLGDGPDFPGLGRIWIADRLVRSGRLPLAPDTQSFQGQALDRLRLLGVETTEGELRIRCQALFQPAAVRTMRDHSFDPIHNTQDWDQAQVTVGGELDLVIRPAQDRFNGVACTGLAYHWAYRGAGTPLFWLMDRASWEIDGDITGATVVSQSACSDPLVTFARDTAWSTEGLIHFAPDMPNPVMTHNLPRWASHQAFDFQCCGGTALLGVFERVGLIRSLLKRESGRAELKCFDKHLFDEAEQVCTVPKRILLVEGLEGDVDQRNLWTWVMDEVHERARQEFGLRDVPLLPRVFQNYWLDFTVDRYYDDLLPAAEAIGARQVFVDNLKKSAMTDRTPHPGKFNWNMCCGHEYEIAPELGGDAGVRRFAQTCAARGIEVVSWTNNDQALSSPIIGDDGHHRRDWFVKMEDTRLRYGGAYTNVLNILDFANDDARRYFIDSHKQLKERAALTSFMFDSFYNLGFMPVSYAGGHPRTMWRQCLAVLKELQDAGIHMVIESFGPFGAVQHGCPRSYSIDRCWVCYRINLGNDYTTVPVGPTHADPRREQAASLYYALAHMTVSPIDLFENEVRVDERFGPDHRQALADYHEALPYLHRRYLQADGMAVLWHDRAGERATLFNFAQRTLALPGAVHDLTTGVDLPEAASYPLRSQHTYAITRTALPRTLTSQSEDPTHAAQL
ncbi:MAG: hypothetical protein WD534_15945 [Phycisphaeraceae bacterium]